MPLNKSGSKAAIGQNIKAEEAAGKPRKQAIAIALNVNREAGDESIKSKHIAALKKRLKK